MRNAAMGSASAGVGLSADAAMSRMQEQNTAQSELAQNLRAMRGQSMQTEGLGAARAGALTGLGDRMQMARGELENQGQFQNLQNEEAARQRALRASLINLGRQDAAAATQTARKGAITQAVVGAGTTLAGAGIDAIVAKKKRDAEAAAQQNQGGV